MTETFAQLLEESFKNVEIGVGTLLTGCVVAIEKDVVLVDVGLKSESAVPIEQFKDPQGLLEVRVGDSVEVVLEALENGYGETLLSREKAKRHEAWRFLEKAHLRNEKVDGIISGKVKGGFTVELSGLRAFLPGSLIDIRPLRDTTHLEGRPLEFKVIKLDQKRNNVVVSRRAVLEAEQSGERDQLLNKLQEGLVLQGVVKNLTDYGAFVDLGGVDGLLHITDMAWKRVRHPSEVVSVGDEITVRVLKFDRDRTRVSLGLKQLEEDPWGAIATRYPEGTIVRGRVTNLTDYGCFVGLESGIEGLVHVSEMDWSNKNIHPSKVVNMGDEVSVMVLDVDVDRRRISLGLKQCLDNPWQRFSDQHAKGDTVRGKVKSVTDFGIFIGLDGDIDGLVHVSDLSWTTGGEVLLKQYKKGDEVSAVVLQVDSDRERISLGVKQLSQDPVSAYLAAVSVGTIVEGVLSALDEVTGRVSIQLAEHVMGSLSKEACLRVVPVDNLQPGLSMSVEVCGLDSKTNGIQIEIPGGESPPKVPSPKKEMKEVTVETSPLNAMSEAFRLAKGE